MTPIRAALVASEAVPYAKTGGLADVIGALPKYFGAAHVEASVIMPRHKGIDVRPDNTISIEMNGMHRVGVARKENFLFIDYPQYFDRNGLYGDAKGDYPDNCERFTLFCKAVTALVTERGFDVVHCHDWQSGLVPLYLKRAHSDAKSMFTIHNLGYQGKFPADKFTLLGVEKEYFTPQGLEFYGDINFLKAGIVYSDMVTTVSKNYAREIQTPELGFGLDGVLRMRGGDLRGIVNGIDYGEWDPGSDKLIYATYDDFDGKRQNKVRLCEDLVFDTARPLIGMVSRIAGQKGFDLLVCAMDEIIGLGFNMVILGFGEESYHRKLEDLQKVYAGRFSVCLKFDNRLAHRIYAGSDFFLMPSKYEPCGLGQLISLRYGAVPIVRQTGGLADTVTEYDKDTGSGNGFLFGPYTARSLADAVARALDVFSDRTAFEKLSHGCMKYDYSWKRSAAEYAKLYRNLLAP